MALWQTLVFCAIVLVILLIFFNIVLPPFINKPFFFLFKKSERKLFEADQDFSDIMTEAQADQVRKGVDLISDQTRYSRDYKPKKNKQPKRSKK